MRKYFTIILCTLSFLASGQKYKLGISAGPNLSFLNVKSNYNYYWSDKYKPGIGFEIGILGSYNLSEKLNFDHTFMFQYLSHDDNNDLNLRDYDGYIIKTIDVKNSNGYLCLSPQVSYRVFNHWSVGSGLNLNLLLFSINRLKDYEEAKVIKNTYYRTFNIGLPVFIMFQNNNFFIRLKFDKGLVNLMKDSNSFFREKENTLSLNIGYFFVNE